VDVNSAFLSWEAVRRISMGEEDIRLIPSAIGGDRTKRTGVILAKSIPAKKYGIVTGEPVASALRKCPSLFLAKPDHLLYERNSRAFTEICKRYAPVVEKFSIDECFLDMTGTELLYPDPIRTAYEIKDTIRDTLGFTVNIGIGSNKLLAKMASDFEKPDKVHTLFSDEIEEKMWHLPVGELFTIGSATAEKLKRSYILTIGDLARADIGLIRSLIGNKIGEHLHNYANGIDTSPVLSEPEEPKGYSISTTLEQDITTEEAAHGILLLLADSVSSRMRRDGQKAKCIGVTLRSGDFKDRSHQRRYEEATDITSEIFEASKMLFRELWDGRTPIRLIGLSLTALTREENTQISLFPDESKEKARRVDKTIDDLRKRFGADTIMRAASCKTDISVGKKYKAKADADRISDSDDQA